MWEENIYFDACDSLVFVLELFELVSGICGVVRRAKAHVAPTGSEYIGSERVITMSGRACQDGRSRARWLRAPVQPCLTGAVPFSERAAANLDVMNPCVNFVLELSMCHSDCFSFDTKFYLNWRAESQGL